MEVDGIAMVMALKLTHTDNNMVNQSDYRIEDY